MNFENQIDQRLRDLNARQLCHFAWLCGIRTLPFLSVRRDFACWPENDRQKHLYSVFYALDVCAQVAFFDNYVDGYELSIDTYFCRVGAATNATRAATNAAKFVVSTARAAGNAATGASIAANTANVVIESEDTSYIADAIARWYGATIRRSENAAFWSDVISTFDQKSLLFKDVEVIKENRLNECDHDTSVYGKLWDDFQEDLIVVDCAYWARFYEDLFKTGFKIDKKQLERHLGVPDEIMEKGAAAAGHYIEGLGNKTERLNEARIIILGEKGAGKTSIARKLFNINAKMPKDHESTEGVETLLWSFPDKNSTSNVNAHIWDFAGHSITHSVHRCFMAARCLYIYVYNGRIERDNDPIYWLEQIRMHGGDSKILFLINEKDRYKVADIPEKTLKDRYPSIVGFYHVDIGGSDKTILEEFRQTVMDMVRNNLSWNNQIVPMEAYEIKNKLREFFNETNSPHITRDKFDEVAKKCGARDERIEEILQDLHTLGICFWYNKEEMEDFNMLVLNPDWITNGIYRIINKGFNEHEHILTVEKGAEMLRYDNHYKYAPQDVTYLFRLMKVYELAFFKDKSNDNIFIPGILPLDMPDGLPTFYDTNDRLTMSFVVEEVLPPNIVSRIIVQRSDDIFDEKLLWRKGAVLKYKNDTFALIVEDMRSITVRIKGTDKTAYIASMRETIKTIFDSYLNIKLILSYEVLIPEEVKPSDSTIIFDERHEPLMLHEDIIREFLDGRQDYLYRKKKIPLDGTAQKYSMSIGRDLTVINNFNVNQLQIGSGNIMDDYSTTFNFHDCAISLQGELNTLARSLQTDKQDEEEAKELSLTAKEMEQMQELIPANTVEISTEVKNNIKKQGLLNRLKSICDDLNDENSALYKKVYKIKRGIQIAQNIAKQYNDIAQWFGLLQVPKQFLGRHGKE